MDVGFGIKFIINMYSTVIDRQEEITHEYDTRHSDAVCSWESFLILLLWKKQRFMPVPLDLKTIPSGVDGFRGTSMALVQQHILKFDADVTP